LLRPALVLVTMVLVADALVGENGLVERMRATRRHQELKGTLNGLREENTTLRQRARRLRSEDPTIVEDLARRHLGMIKPGEVLFIIKDLEDRSSASRSSPHPATPAQTK
jgi:cell division protein FtsB